MLSVVSATALCGSSQEAALLGFSFISYLSIEWLVSLTYGSCQKVSRTILGWHFLEFVILSQISCNCHFESGVCKVNVYWKLTVCSGHFVHVDWQNPYNTPVSLVLLLSQWWNFLQIIVRTWIQILWFQSWY